MGAYGWLSLGGRDVENERFMVEGMGLQDEGFMVDCEWMNVPSDISNLQI